MNDIPKVTAFEIKENLNNSQERYVSSKENIKKERVNVPYKINEIFSSSSHVYKSRVRITTKDDILEKVIIGKTKDELLTISGQKIKIKDIIDIEKI